MISSIFRRGGDVTFVTHELRKIWSLEGAWINQKYVPSLVAAIAERIEEHFVYLGLAECEDIIDITLPETLAIGGPKVGEMCDRCGQPAVVRVEGCKKCTSCGNSDCG
jgi:ribonucleoside-diphosphate reductase alpha chain